MSSTLKIFRRMLLFVKNDDLKADLQAVWRRVLSSSLQLCVEMHYHSHFASGCLVDSLHR